MYSVSASVGDGLSARLDKWLFFVLFVIGATAMSVEKSLQAPWWVAPGTGAGAIVVFCALSWRTPRFRLREDRIGDGAYYLGFLFTLVSLAFTLFQFTEQGGTEGVISGFGVALVTTIVGLACRVLFQQLREDPLEIEQEVRQTLSTEVLNLEREIRISVEAMSLLRTRTEDELRNAVGAGLKELLKDSREAMTAEAEAFRSAILTTLEGVTNAVDAAKAQAADTKRTSARLIKSIDALAERINASELPTEGLVKQIDGVAAIWQKVLNEEIARIQSTNRSADAILSVYKEMESNALNAAVAMEECKKSAQGLNLSIAQSTTMAGELADASRRISEDLVERGGRAVEIFERVARVSTVDEEALKGLRKSLESHVQVSAGALMALERNVVQASELIVKELSAK